jgi:4-aminobutyrate aminotransferase-like enzyme/Ser/Thr protein kinase RdoA (MazF antagonist)
MVSFHQVRMDSGSDPQLYKTPFCLEMSLSQPFNFLHDRSKTMMPELEILQPVTQDEAIQLAQDVYGFEARVRPLPGEYDDNFHVTAADDRAFILKIMHPHRDHALIDLQCQALDHLAKRAPDLRVPRVQVTQRGEPFTKVALRTGDERFVWMLHYLPGRVLARMRPHSADLLRSLGRLLGELDRALQDFSHPAAVRALKWDSAQPLWIRGHLSCIEDPERRALVERALARFESNVVPVLPKLRKSVIYGDANDHNILINDAAMGSHEVSVIDFGDMHYGLLVSEPAIAAAYAILGKSDPLAAAAAVVKGFHHALPLEESEISILFPLIETRLAVSVVNSAQRKALVPDNTYVSVSEAPAWEALGQLAKIHPRFAHYAIREACGLPPVPQGPSLAAWLAEQGKTAASVLDQDLRAARCHVLDLSFSSTLLGADPANLETPALTAAIEEELKRANAEVGVGRYDEPRPLYTSPLFANSSVPTEERRTVHIAIDLFVPPGANVRAPLAGVIHTLADNQAPLDYGPVVILRHVAGNGKDFFTLYGHLSRKSIRQLSVGQSVAKGQAFAQLGTDQENGGWSPHLHIQLIVDLLELDRDFPGVARASEREIWKSLCPDPNLLLGIPPERFPQGMSLTETLAQRRRVLGSNLSLSYRNPLKVVRGWRQYLYDETGRAFLDLYNNVPLVGHNHPKVARAVREQLGLLNTNTRYLHENILHYAHRLTEKLPEPLRICYLINSGSEANELAIRLARAHTGAEDIIVLEHAYHGHTTTLIDVSPSKFLGPGGRGRKPWVHVAPLADDYRGIYRRGEPDLGARYARHVAEILSRLREQQRGVCAYLAETMPSVGGQIVFPPGYLAEVYRHVRAAGGVCIADEVQVGFGRLGSHFWGFESQGVIPDIVVLGKPIGNGFPLAAVVTTPEVAASFDNGMEFFSTFGGNPVACAAGQAVLDVLEEEDLQANALRIGHYLVAGLKDLQTRHPLIGDIRGSGLFLGLDLVQDNETRHPATGPADYVVNRLRERGILTGTDGPHHNVLKLRPPLIFSRADAGLFLATLDSVLSEDAAQPG